MCRHCFSEKAKEVNEFPKKDPDTGILNDSLIVREIPGVSLHRHKIKMQRHRGVLLGF